MHLRNSDGSPTWLSQSLFVLLILLLGEYRWIFLGLFLALHCIKFLKNIDDYEFRRGKSIIQENYQLQAQLLEKEENEKEMGEVIEPTDELFEKWRLMKEKS